MHFLYCRASLTQNCTYEVCHLNGFIHSLYCSTMCECIKIILIHSIIGEHLGNLHMEILQMALPKLFLHVSFGDHLCTVLQGTNLRLEMLGHSIQI